MSSAEIQLMKSRLTVQSHAAKYELLKKIIEQCLPNTEITSNDLKRFQIVTHANYPGREFVGFNGNMIGEIEYFHKQNDFKSIQGWKFTPKPYID